MVMKHSVYSDGSVKSTPADINLHNIKHIVGGGLDSADLLTFIYHSIIILAVIIIVTSIINYFTTPNLHGYWEEQGNRFFINHSRLKNKLWSEINGVKVLEGSLINNMVIRTRKLEGPRSGEEKLSIIKKEGDKLVIYPIQVGSASLTKI
jgi:hypothetical protein